MVPKSRFVLGSDSGSVEAWLLRYLGPFAPDFSRVGRCGTDGTFLCVHEGVPSRSYA